GRCNGFLDGSDDRIGLGRLHGHFVRSMDSLVTGVAVILVLMIMTVMVMIMLMLVGMIVRIMLVVLAVMRVVMGSVRLRLICGMIDVGLWRREESGIGAGGLDDLAADVIGVAAAALTAVAGTAAMGAVLVLFLGVAMGALVGLDQRLTIGDRDLVVVGMDFA